jgi:hypothetical protein
MSALRLWSSRSHVERVFNLRAAGSKDWMRFDVAWLLVIQDRGRELKRAVCTCELTSALATKLVTTLKVKRLYARVYNSTSSVLSCYPLFYKYIQLSY